MFTTAANSEGADLLFHLGENARGMITAVKGGLEGDPTSILPITMNFLATSLALESAVVIKILIALKL